MPSPSRGRAGRLSAHFVASEFACPHCGVSVVRDDLVQLLERVRSHVKKPLHIVSGYRCPVHNAAIGGAPNSQHMYGAAADVASGLLTEPEARSEGAVGIGTKGEWAIHVDVRDGPLVLWVYK